MKATRTVIIALILSSATLGSAIAKTDHNPGIVNIGANAHGKSYSELALQWWVWAAQTPVPQSALFDPTGANCAIGQPLDHIWFLAGTLGDGSASRTCTVPNGSFLFFPLANDIAGAFPTDPDDQRTEEFLRAQTECVVGAELHAWIDGVPVNDPAQYLEQTALFNLQLPVDNIFGIPDAADPGLMVTPAVDRGYYLYVNPLPPGPHTIRYTTAPGTAACGTTQDITYNLTIGK